ncbi:uncharacterized protein TNCV_3723481 [Trichonephila clavipes]|nr:uncharacterized protein TNCV_3723481 [Trichonephila clavipes]
MVKSIARKRKRQFYGNKFTNTSKKNSTSAVPECTASCSKLGNESFLTAEEMPGHVFGNRIVDLELNMEAFAQLCCPKCFAENVELFEDSRYGLCSHFTLKSKLLKVVQEGAEESMIKDATEIGEKKQNLSSDIVKYGISVDGTWQRRGYTSMNGCVAAISVDTGKVLDIEVMCRPTVQHRVGSRLRKLKTKIKGLSGKGKLTDNFMDRLQNYYGIAVRSNVGNLNAMQQNVIAALYHCASSDKKPMHGQCPIGKES